MFLVPINYLAIIACGVLSMVLGFLWYGPLFGSEWRKLIGMTTEKMARAKNDMTKTYSISFVSSLVMAYVLAHFVWFSAPGAGTVLVGIKTGVWAWLGFVATTSLSAYLYSTEKKPNKLFVIETGYFLVLLVLMGVILAVWR